MEADKELSCASWCTVSTRANVFPILFSERSAPFGNEACACSFCPSHGSHQCFKYKQRVSRCLFEIPMQLFTGIFSELFSAQSLQLIGSTSLRLRFWNESPAFARRLLSQRAAWETKESESYCFLFGVGEGAQIPVFEQCTLFGGATLGAVWWKSPGRDS